MQFIFFLLLLAGMAQTAVPAKIHSPKIPFSFERNEGQTSAAVQYLARGDGYTLFLNKRGAVLSFPGTGRSVSMSLAGGQMAARIDALDALPQRSNYFVGQDQSKWRHDVPHFARVQYGGVYPGIDLIFHSLENQLEYDFVIAPGTNPDHIELQFDGIDSTRILSSGELSLQLGKQTLTHKAPIAYQEINGKRHLVGVSYERRNAGRTGFRLGEYDHKRPLVILKKAVDRHQRPLFRNRIEGEFAEILEDSSQHSAPFRLWA